jgi:periplasmic copper chaperone A
MNHLRSSAFLCGFIALAFAAAAEVTATDAWVRGTVPAQTTTGAFLTLHSTDFARIVEVRSPAATDVQIHSSEMEHGVMRMRAMDDILLLPGKSVELKPGGYHIMLMGLAKPLAQGDQVPLTFLIEDTKGKRTTLEVKAEVRRLGK